MIVHMHINTHASYILIDKLQARGTFADGASIMVFLDGIKNVLADMNNGPARLLFIEFHGPRSEIETLNTYEGIAALNPQYFEEVSSVDYSNPKFGGTLKPTDVGQDGGGSSTFRKMGDSILEAIGMKSHPKERPVAVEGSVDETIA
jgi:hypothetical protein